MSSKTATMQVLYYQEESKPSILQPYNLTYLFIDLLSSTMVVTGAISTESSESLGDHWLTTCPVRHDEHVAY